MIVITVCSVDNLNSFWVAGKGGIVSETQGTPKEKCSV